MQVEFLWHRHMRYPKALRRRVLAAMAPATITTEEIARLNADVGDAFARAAVNAIAAAPKSQRPELIGLAGQTICHLPSDRSKRTVTFQLGQAAPVVAATGVTTVDGFRQSDVAVGGEGAPLVPWTDYVLFRSNTQTRMIQNIGGIANVTCIPAGGAVEDVIAFDNGPGNMIIDAVVSRATKGRETFDRNGRRATRGKVLAPVLRDWLKHPYLKRKPPKSTGRELFGEPFVRAKWSTLLRASSEPNDWIATATAFTAQSIALSYKRFLGNAIERSPFDLVVCGGGARNKTLLTWLADALPSANIEPMDALGIPSQSKEAISFALLAAACVDRCPANLPQVTRATRPAVLGAVSCPPT